MATRGAHVFKGCFYDAHARHQVAKDYEEKPIDPAIAERIRIELEKSRTDDFCDPPARVAPPPAPETPKT